MHKKAVGFEVFMYLLGIIIFALLLIIGYKMIIGFKAKSDSIILIKFQKDLQSTIDSVSFGTTKVRTFEVPPGYKEFWLVDGACASAPPLIDPDAETNAYLIGPEKFEAFTIERVNLGAGCLHAEVVNNQITLGLAKG